MISKEQHMNIFENQRNKYEQIKEKRRRTTEKPMKNQRRNNEKQWKTKDNFASILSYLLPGIFGPCFFEVFIFNGERNKRHFWGKKGILRCLGSYMFTKPCKYAVNCIVSCICASNGVELFFCLLFFWWFYGGKTLAGENLECHFRPKICILYGNTVVRGLAHWNIHTPAF